MPLPAIAKAKEFSSFSSAHSGAQLHAARAYWEVKAQSFRHFVLTKQVAKLPAGPCLSHLVLLQGDEMLSCRCWCAFALSFFIDADKVSELLSPCRASPTPSVLSAGHRAGSSNGLFLVPWPSLCPSGFGWACRRPFIRSQARLQQLLPCSQSPKGACAP